MIASLREYLRQLNMMKKGPLIMNRNSFVLRCAIRILSIAECSRSVAVGSAASYLACNNLS